MAQAPAAAAGQAAGQAAAGELWVERYAPSSEAELVVHKKKVQEVRGWLQQQRDSLGQPGVSRLLVVSGPSGCGKSAVLSTLAAALGFDVSEWRPPNAVQREEAEYAGMQHRSKLDEFNEFVTRTKMPHLSLSSSSSGRQAGSGDGAAPSSAAVRRSQAMAAAAGNSAAVAAGGNPAAVAAANDSGQGVAVVQPTQQRPGRLPPSLLPTLVIVDDLPHAAGPQQRQQIADALADLAAGARFPVVVVATETSGKAQQEKGLSAAAGTYQGLHKELIAVLEAHKATTISLNPFTTANIAKALRSILERQRRVLPDADVAAIAEQSNGDLHNAISTLQFVCTGVQRLTAGAAAAAAAKQRGRGTKRKAAATAAGGAAAAAAAAAGSEGGLKQSQVAYALRDSMLSLFHALGKLLYNKRLPGDGSQQPSGNGSMLSQSQQQQWSANCFWQAAGGGSSGAAAAAGPSPPLAAWAQRQPMEFDPEAVLVAAGLEAGSVTAFLHENLLHFIEDSAIEDAAACLEHLSAADCMSNGRRWGSGDAPMAEDDMPSSTLLDAAAASTAARGVCFSNSHPAPRRWLPLKAPAVFTVLKGVAANRDELSRHTAAAWAVHGGMSCLEPCGRLASELLPYARSMAARSHDPALQRLLPASWTRFWNGKLHEQQHQGGGGGGQQRAGGGGGSGASWRQEQEEAAAGGGREQQHTDDVIEESDDEDDW